MTARARKTDPISSHKAAAKMNKKEWDIKHESKIMLALSGNGFMTAHEIAKAAGFKDNVLVCRRMQELVDSELVVKEDTAKVICSVCNQRRISWKITRKGARRIKNLKEGRFGG